MIEKYYCQEANSLNSIRIGNWKQIDSSSHISAAIEFAKEIYECYDYDSEKFGIIAVKTDGGEPNFFEIYGDAYFDFEENLCIIFEAERKI